MEDIDVAGSSSKRMDRLIRRRERTVAIVGFPAAGKTAFLYALGNQLMSGPSAIKGWQVLHSRSELLTLVQEMQNRAGTPWELTAALLPPLAVDLFSVRRWGARFDLSSGDTSGEHYLYIAGRHTKLHPDVQELVDQLANDVLPYCAGYLLMVDGSSTMENIGNTVTDFQAIFAKIHGTGDQEDKEAASRRRHAHRNRPIPISIAMTKCDLLIGRAVTAPRDECRYLQFLKERNRAELSDIPQDGAYVTYKISRRSMLESGSEELDAEAVAVIRDYIDSNLTVLGGWIARLEQSEDYEVFVTPVSAWGQSLKVDETNAELAPAASEIDSARLIEPILAVVRRMYEREWRRIGGTLGSAVLALALIILLLLPGVFHGAVATMDYALRNKHTSMAYGLSSLARWSPHADFLKWYRRESVYQYGIQCSSLIEVIEEEDERFNRWKRLNSRINWALGYPASTRALQNFRRNLNRAYDHSATNIAKVEGEKYLRGIMEDPGVVAHYEEHPLPFVTSNLLEIHLSEYEKIIAQLRPKAETEDGDAAKKKQEEIGELFHLVDEYIRTVTIDVHEKEDTRKERMAGRNLLKRVVAQKHERFERATQFRSWKNSEERQIFQFNLAGDEFAELLLEVVRQEYICSGAGSRILYAAVAQERDRILAYFLKEWQRIARISCQLRDVKLEDREIQGWMEFAVQVVDSKTTLDKAWNVIPDEFTSHKSYLKVQQAFKNDPAFLKDQALSLSIARLILAGYPDWKEAGLEDMASQELNSPEAFVREAITTLHPHELGRKDVQTFKRAVDWVVLKGRFREHEALVSDLFDLIEQDESLKIIADLARFHTKWEAIEKNLEEGRPETALAISKDDRLESELEYLWGRVGGWCALLNRKSTFVAGDDSRGYYLAKCPVAIKEYREFLAKIPDRNQRMPGDTGGQSRLPEKDSLGGPFDSKWDLDGHRSSNRREHWEYRRDYYWGDILEEMPVTLISPADARAYCAFRCQGWGKLSIRLPTDNEWMTAAGKHSDRKDWPWGSSPPRNAVDNKYDGKLGVCEKMLVSPPGDPNLPQVGYNVQEIVATKQGFGLRGMSFFVLGSDTEPFKSAYAEPDQLKVISRKRGAGFRILYLTKPTEWEKWKNEALAELKRQ